MKTIIAILIFIISNIDAYNQSIRGTVLDKQTNNTIWLASVYFNGTFVGTTSDKDGNFEIDISNNASRSLTVSATGYYSTTLTDYSNQKPLIIYLTPKIYDINEVTVSTKSLVRKRKRNLRFFKNEFLGLTANARECEILNENDITFNYYADSDTLMAFAEKPILIENRALGYNITYFLDKFEYYKKSSRILFQGNILFNEDVADLELRQQAYESKRRDAYFGSRMHFFRILWSDNLLSSGFELRDSLYQKISREDIVLQYDTNKTFLKSTGSLRIYYNNRISSIAFLKGEVYFDKAGYFDPLGLVWEGDMARLRVADWLPYELLIEE